MSINFSIKYVGGYNGGDILSLTDEVIVFGAGKNVICLNKRLFSQYIFTGHENRILSICYSRIDKVICSIDESFLLVWHYNDIEGTEIQRISNLNFLSKVTSATSAFLENSPYILINYIENERSVCVIYDWKSSSTIWNEYFDHIVIGFSFNPNNRVILIVDETKVSQIVSFISPFTIVYDQIDSFKITVCFQVNYETLICGCANGCLLRFTNDKCVEVEQSVHSHITLLTADDVNLISFGLDNDLCLWHLDRFEPIRIFNNVLNILAETSLNGYSNPSSIAPGKISLLLGTRSSDIYEISIVDGADLNKGKPIVSSHYYQISGSIHVDKSFISIGRDGRMIVWDPMTHKHMNVLVFPSALTAININTFTKNYAVAINRNGRGSIVLLNNAYEVISQMSDSRYPISKLIYSTNNAYLAAVTDDGTAIIYSVNDDYRILSRFSQHNCLVSELEFSIHGDMFRMLSETNKSNIVNVLNGSAQKYVNGNDLKWESDRCIFRKSVVELSSANDDEKYITTINSDAHLKAYGTKTGRICAFASKDNSIPGIDPVTFSSRTETHGHVNTVSSIQYCAIDNELMLITTGHDGCVIFWHVSTG